MSLVVSFVDRGEKEKARGERALTTAFLTTDSSMAGWQN
jgi:hypothetical protein